VRRLLKWLLILIVIAAAVAAALAPPYVDAMAFIARAADLGGIGGDIAAARAQTFVADPIRQIPTRHGPIDVRLYHPAQGTPRRVVTLVPGVHMDGIRESRLVGLAEDLAASGYSVLTVATPDLQQFRITPASTDIIEDAAKWLVKESQPSDGPSTGSGPSRAQSRDGKIGMLGISFSGGLSIVAAGRPELRDHVAFVMSFGGHGDLQRVMRYLCSGNAPPMPALGEATHDIPGAEHVSIRPPHDYGVAVVLLTFAERIVPADQVEPLRQGILTFLKASSLDMVDKPKAEIEFTRARALETTLPEPARTLMAHVNNRAVDKLGPILLPAVESVKDAREHTALSPERATPPAAPVFLLHGVEDNVIPSVETVLLTNYLRGKTEVHAVLSGLVTHAEVDKSAAAIEVWRLANFWKGIMEK
jgi:dienelactone hydrolase